MDVQLGYPLLLTNLKRVVCVVVGGGAVAERKTRGLIAGGAAPLLICPTLTDALVALRAAGAITHHARHYQPGDLQGAFLAIAATNDNAVNATVAAEGAARGILVNVADAPEAGTFHTMATVRRGDLLLAVSTGGASPTLAAHIRRDLAQRYGEGYGALLALLRRLRDGPAQQLGPAQRAQLWQRLLATNILALAEQGELARVEAYAVEQIVLLADA